MSEMRWLWKTRETSWKTITVIPPWGNQGCKRTMEEHGEVKRVFWCCEWFSRASCPVAVAKTQQSKKSRETTFLICWIQFILFMTCWIQDVVVECHSPNRWSSGFVESPFWIKATKEEITTEYQILPDLL